MTVKAMKLNRIEDNIRTAPGLHGASMAGSLIGKGEVVIVELDTPESPHDGWVHIVGPNPPINPDGTYLGYGNAAWIKLGHLDETGANIEVFNLKVEINWNERTVRFI